MKISSTRTGPGIRALLSVCLSLTPAIAQTATTRIVSAANMFFSTLDQKQRQAVLFSFDDEEERKRWSNFPVSFVRRGGISLKDLNSAQRSAAMALVASALSPKASRKFSKSWKATRSTRILTRDHPAIGDPARDPVAEGRRPEMGVRLHLALRVIAGRPGTARYLAKIYITSLSLASPPRRIRGCCSSVVTISR
jgi:hypothetical protein